MTLFAYHQKLQMLIRDRIKARPEKMYSGQYHISTKKIFRTGLAR